MSIDLKKEILSYKPFDLSCIPDNPLSQMENIRDSISLYNKAIERLKSKSEDIAVIELKKAVALNPEFSEAINLLGLCYMVNKDYEKAEEMFRKAKDENNGAKSSKYIEMIAGVNKQPTGKKSDNKSHEAKNSTKISSDVKNLDSGNMLKKSKPAGRLSIYQLDVASKRKKQSSLVRYSLISVIVVCIIILGVMVIDKSGIIANQKNEANAKNRIYSKNSSTNQSTQAMLKTAVNSEEEKKQQEYQKNVEKLNEVDKLVAANEFEAAGDILAGLKNAGFKDKDKQKYDELNTVVMPKATLSVYNKAEADFNNGNYQNAVNNYKKVVSYGYEWEYLPLAMYHYGLSYKELANYDDAVKVFGEICTRFPGNEYAQYAGYRISDIDSIRGNTANQGQANVQNQQQAQNEQNNNQGDSNSQQTQSMTPETKTFEQQPQQTEKQTQNQPQKKPDAEVGNTTAPNAGKQGDQQSNQHAQDNNGKQTPSQNQTTTDAQ